MLKRLLILNAILTFPFGVFALATPTAVFAQFGLQLDASGELIARGYGATLVAYGIVLYLARGVTDVNITRALLLSMTVFNVIEAAIQGIAGAQGVAAPIIFGNVAIHSAVALICVNALFRSSTGIAR